MNKCRYTYPTPIVDVDYEEHIKSYCWYIDNRGYVTAWIPEKKEHQTLHIFLWGKPPKGKIWDHENQNKLDNRSKNIRLVSKSLNAFNSKVRSDNTSGTKGVAKKRKGWRAYITKDGQQIGLGTFKYKIAAIRARKHAERNWAEMKGFLTV